MDQGNQSHLDWSYLLGGTYQGLRDHTECGAGWQEEGFVHGAPGHAVGDPDQVERLSSREIGRGRLVPGRLWEGQQRWPNPLHPAETLERPPRGRVDEDCRRDGDAGGGRAGRVEEERRRTSGRRTGREGSPRRQRSQEGEFLEFQVAKKEEKDKGEEGQRGRQTEGERQEGNPRREESHRSVWKDRIRPKTWDSTQDASKSQEGGKEEREEGQLFIQQELNNGEQWLRGRRRIEHLRRRDQSEDGVGQSARRIDLGGDFTNADFVGETVWGAVGVEPRSGSPHLQPVLAPIPSPKNEWADESRGTDDLFRPGLVDPGEDCTGVRRFDSEGQIFGTNFRRFRLSNLATSRVGATRSLKFVNQCRDLGCLQTTPGGTQSKGCIQQRRLGKQERRSRSLGRERKREKQGLKRKRQEGKLEKGRRKRRKGAQEEGRLKSVGEGAKIDLREGIEEKFHGEEIQGRVQGPTQNPPMVFEPEVSLGSLVGTMQDEKNEKKDEEGGKRFEDFLEERTLGNVSGGAASVELLSAKGLEGKSFGEVAPMMLKVFDQCLQDAKLKHSKIKTSGGIFPYLKLFKSYNF